MPFLSGKQSKTGRAAKSKRRPPAKKRRRTPTPAVVDDTVESPTTIKPDTPVFVEDETIKLSSYESGLVNTSFASFDESIVSNDFDVSSVNKSFLQNLTELGTIFGTLVNRTGLVTHKGGRLL